MKNIKVCHFTSVHAHNDIRIFIKECQSLAQHRFEVHFIVPGIEDCILEGIKIHGIKKVRNNRMQRMTQTANAVFKEALKINADVYHFHDPELIPIGLKLKKRGKKVIYDIHEDLPRAILSKHWINPFIRKPSSWFFELYENQASKKFDYLMPATPYITKRFKKINENVVNINNYPLLNELKEFNVAEKHTKQKQVCYVGGFGEIRGGKQVLEAANLTEGTIHIAGPISNKELKEKVKHHPKVEYLGFLNREEVKNLLASSIAGIVTFLPEPNHINAQPNKMFEYMSAGIPVICSDFPLWRSIIEKHDCGICVDPEDAGAIASAINFLFDNPEVAKRMGENGRAAVETEYNWERESTKLVDAYKKLIK